MEQSYTVTVVGTSFKLRGGGTGKATAIWNSALVRLSQLQIKKGGVKKKRTCSFIRICYENILVIYYHIITKLKKSVLCIFRSTKYFQHKNILVASKWIRKNEIKMLKKILQLIEIYFNTFRTTLKTQNRSWKTVIFRFLK